ncbi:MAG TPA: saccharopine dehydrogenase C-terminal domain-containing protein [Vicinamibacterales bacterium]|nr:saccharopine dehydrogenase C-terminal domain-containing protein [Vicinamibacterales bacterium]
MGGTRVLVAGGGAIGSAIAFDLARDGTHEVTIADVDADRLQRASAQSGAKTVVADLSRDDTLRRLASGYDLVVGALPSVLGYRSLSAVVDAGRPLVDVSFMAQDPLALDARARDSGVAAVVDCGVAPGLSHMIVGFAATRMSSVERVAIYVGGLPAARGSLFDYKAPFSPFDVIEECVRPARIVEDGRVAVRDALEEPELLHIDGFGEVEAFLTDGLRTLTHTIQSRFMVEKTLRYPGHRAAMAALRDAGMFSTTAVEAGGRIVRPLDVTAALLFPRWQYEDGEPDVTILRVVVEGKEAESRADIRCTASLVDRYDPATAMRSMSRTTAFPAASVVRLVERGLFRPGVHPPEAIGRLGLLDEVLKDLAARGVHCDVRFD